MINLKRDLIYRIEEINAQYLVPQKYFTIVVALMIENRPITQDEIISLTGYGRSQVSQVLNQIIPMGLVEFIKIRGNRKKHFQTQCDFIDIYFKPIKGALNIMNSANEIVQPIVEKLNKFKSNHPEIIHFRSFLVTFSKIIEVQVRMMEELESEILKWKTQKPMNFNINFDISLKKLLTPESNPPMVISALPKIKPLRDDLKENVDKIKQEFIQILETYSHRLGADKEYASIMDILFFEFNPVNQDRLIKLTGYARSTISTILNGLKGGHFVQKVKIKGDRKKYYIPSFPLNKLISVKFAKSHIYMESCKSAFSKTRTRLTGLDSKRGNSEDFMNFLETGIDFFELIRKNLLMFLYKFINETNSIEPLRIPFLKERV